MIVRVVGEVMVEMGLVWRIALHWDSILGNRDLVWFGLGSMAFSDGVWCSIALELQFITCMSFIPLTSQVKGISRHQSHLIPITSEIWQCRSGWSSTGRA